MIEVGDIVQYLDRPTFYRVVRFTMPDNFTLQNMDTDERSHFWSSFELKLADPLIAALVEASHRP